MDGREQKGNSMKAVVEVTWILAAIPGSSQVGNHLELRDGSRIPITVLEQGDSGGWFEDRDGFATVIDNE